MATKRICPNWLICRIENDVASSTIDWGTGRNYNTAIHRWWCKHASAHNHSDCIAFRSGHSKKCVFNGPECVEVNENKDM